MTVPELVVKRLAVIAVSAIASGTLLTALALFQPGKIDAAIIGVIGADFAIGSAALGALGAILASTRSPSDPPAPVTVVNPPADPVQTADVEATPVTRKRSAKKTAARSRRR